MIFALLPLNSWYVILDVVLDPHGRLMGHFWITLNALLATLGASLAICGASWATFESLLVHFWIMCRFGITFGPLLHPRGRYIS